VPKPDKSATDNYKLEPDPGGLKMLAADESKTDHSKTGDFEPRAFDPGGWSTKEAVIDSTDKFTNFLNACAPLRVRLRLRGDG
jgi:hypothetical protein